VVLALLADELFLDVFQGIVLAGGCFLDQVHFAESALSDLVQDFKVG